MYTESFHHIAVSSASEIFSTLTQIADDETNRRNKHTQFCADPVKAAFSEIANNYEIVFLDFLL